MINNKHIWNINDGKTDYINEFYSIAEQIYFNREIQTNHKEFFAPTIHDLLNPFDLPDMNIAVDRIITAINNKEKVIVYGDYDVDGITSITTLKNVLSDLGLDIDYYIPDRMSEGYGVNINAIKKLVGNYNLLITVDCGITSLEECKYAMDNGLDVIVTDHHLPLDNLPLAIAVVNPKRVDNVYKNDNLAGVGVIFKVCHALLIKLFSEQEAKKRLVKYLDVVAIGTVADIVSLTGENRTIVSLGLAKLNEGTSLLGLTELINVSDLKNKEILSSHISFRIAPRLNAGGRVGSAKDSLELILSDNKQKAMELARLLDDQNEKRKNIEKRIEFEAIELIEKDPIKYQNFIVLYKEDWHHGVLGIVASRLVERYYRPVLLFSKEQDFIKGSGRSISGLHLQQLLTKYQDYFIGFGGHAMAVGASMSLNKLEELHIKLSNYIEANCTDLDLTPKLEIDSIIEIPSISQYMYSRLNKLKPFGIGNKTPTFLIKGCEVISISSLGQGRHTKLGLKQYDTKIDCLLWNKSNLELKVNDIIDVVGKIDENKWRNKSIINVIGRDLRKIGNSKIIDNRYCINKEDVILELVNSSKQHAIVFYGYDYGSYKKYITNDIRPIGRELILYYNNESYKIVKNLENLPCQDIIIYDVPIHHEKLLKLSNGEDICYYLVYNNNDSKQQLSLISTIKVNRQSFKELYRYLLNKEEKYLDLDNTNLSEDTNETLVLKLTVLKIFEELGFIMWFIEENKVYYSFNKNINKSDLSSSCTYNFYKKLLDDANKEHQKMFLPINEFNKILLRGTKNEY